MEYLMTYGWALLVIVVVGAALFALGVLNPSTYTQKRCQGLQYFTYQDHKLTASQFVFDVINGPQTIKGIDNVTVNGVANATAGTVTGSLNGGGRFTTTVPVTSGGTAGSSYNYAITIQYDVSGGIQDNIDRGTCTGTIA